MITPELTHKEYLYVLKATMHTQAVRREIEDRLAIDDEGANMIRNIHGCKEDREAELAAEAEELAHNRGECLGYPRCLHCIDARELAEESKGG